MWFLLLLPIVSSTVVIQEYKPVDVCIFVYASSGDNSSAYYAFHTWMQRLQPVLATTYHVCGVQAVDSVDVIKAVAECSCLNDKLTDVNIVYSDEPQSTLATFIGNQNTCTKLQVRKAAYIHLNKSEEFFIYGKRDLKLCFLSSSYLGLDCDSANPTTWPTIDYNIQSIIHEKPIIYDIPEITYAVGIYPEADPTYICKRVDDNGINPTYFFAGDNSIQWGDQMAREINWGNVWNKVVSVSQALYKILDLFFNEKERIEQQPRYEL
uniref:Outer capsid glycoprotein VP7 n=1 Tax=Rotavirus I TaxID=1637496 RepID=A0A0E3GNI1_9REOV|nr:VP7 [Rotavirus I]